jgi:hypothetical protein
MLAGITSNGGSPIFAKATTSPLKAKIRFDSRSEPFSKVFIENS